MFTFMSCDNEEECESTEDVAILSSEMVDTAAINETVDIKIEFDVTNGCGALAGSTGTVDTSNVVSIVVRAKYTGCICTEAIERLEETISYLPPAAGTYFFEFQKDGVVNHRDTLVVQ